MIGTASSKPINTYKSGDKRELLQIDKVMTPGIIFTATVEAVSVPTNTIQVRLQHNKKAVNNCVYAPGILSGMLGFKTSYLPPPKTDVLVVNLGYSPVYILGCLPGTVEDIESPARPVIDSKNDYSASKKFVPQLTSASPVFAKHKPPIDLTEGELQIDNMLGVGLSLLRGLAKIQAGGLAAVECHLVNDMVRIISDTFQHFTAFGDYTIKNDGGHLTVEWHGTSHDFEAWGNLTENDPKVNFSEGNRINNQLDGFIENGRWRFSQYIGFLGDFINMWVSDPQEQVGRVAEGQLRSGKARLHVNNNGSILIQSVSEIAIEKVVRIPIPIQIAITGASNDNKSTDTLNPIFLKDWTPSNASNVFEVVFQLREYARWLSNQYSLSRFHQLNKRFQIPSESQLPIPDFNSHETDRIQENKNNPINYRLAYATYRIFRDGSIQHIDAYGNSYTSTQTGIQISSVGDLRLEAAGNIYMSAGGTINILSKLGINISSMTDSIRIKCAEYLEFFSNNVISATAKNICQLVSQIGEILLGGDVLVTEGLDVANSFSANGSFGIDGNIASFNGTFIAQTLASMLNPICPDQSDPNLLVIVKPGSFIDESQTITFPSFPSFLAIPIPQPTVNTGTAYESPTQQYIRIEQDEDGFTEWDFNSFTIGSETIPWNSQQLTFNSTEKMNTPSTQTTFSNTPSSGMQSENTTMFVKS